ncbi:MULTISPECIES: type II toxin-antitoxin system YoeB family toxin [unclassified Phaeobacter]|uniref:type II toxin-antitoxin system YoeB family toxin n=1 Tax=unclassified Phaeobacter TaxID=2621772 RepID=UPI003A88D4FA
MLALKGDLSGWWSRRITAEHRFVYRVSGKGNGQSLEIAQLRHNYCSIRLFATMLIIKKVYAPRLLPQLFVWLQPRVCGNSPGFSTMRMFQSILGRQPDPGTL